MDPNIRDSEDFLNDVNHPIMPYDIPLHKLDNEYQLSHQDLDNRRSLSNSSYFDLHGYGKNNDHLEHYIKEVEVCLLLLDI